MQMWLTKTMGNFTVFHQPYLFKLNTAVYQWIINLLRFVEYCGALGSIMSGLMDTVFYQKVYKNMINREAETAGLGPGQKVLHIGCGSYPYTALNLSARGLQVDALECDRRAVITARELLKKKEKGGNINVFFGDGRHADCRKYDAVWISLHVYPRQEILDRVLSLLPDGGIIVYRNPRESRLKLYTKVEPDNIESIKKGNMPCHVERINVLPVCETVVIKKNGRRSDDGFKY